MYIVFVYSACFFALYVTVYLHDHKHKKWIKAVAFVIAGWSVTPGALHLLFADQRVVAGFIYEPWFYGGVSASVGALVYALKFPERYFPETFDIWMSSHTIFHFMILITALMHFWASLRTFH